MMLVMRAHQTADQSALLKSITSDLPLHAHPVPFHPIPCHVIACTCMYRTVPMLASQQNTEICDTAAYTATATCSASPCDSRFHYSYGSLHPSSSIFSHL
jgi:hypothetical protein